MQFAMYSQLMDPTGHRIYADLMDELKEQTLLCEEAGFHSVWIDEHHFLAGQNCSTNPIVPGSMLAAHTERVRIGLTNVAGCWQPLRLAEDVALLDHISRGRGRGGYRARNQSIRCRQSESTPQGSLGPIHWSDLIRNSNPRHASTSPSSLKF